MSFIIQYRCSSRGFVPQILQRIKKGHSLVKWEFIHESLWILPADISGRITHKLRTILALYKCAGSRRCKVLNLAENLNCNLPGFVWKNWNILIGQNSTSQNPFSGDQSIGDPRSWTRLEWTIFHNFFPCFCYLNRERNSY